MNTVSFDALRWIGQQYPSLNRVVGGGAQQVLHFALMWNIFECEFCQSSANVSRLKSVATLLSSRGLADHPDVEAFLDFICTRYYASGRTTSAFQSLNLRSKSEVDAVEAVVSRRKTSSEDTLFAQLLVIYRYRNNTFHGLKSIADIFNGLELFDKAARILAAALEHR